MHGWCLPISHLTNLELLLLWMFNLLQNWRSSNSFAPSKFVKTSLITNSIHIIFLMFTLMWFIAVEKLIYSQSSQKYCNFRAYTDLGASNVPTDIAHLYITLENFTAAEKRKVLPNSLFKCIIHFFSFR